MSDPTSTPSRLWDAAIERRGIAAFPVRAYRRVVVVAAHPDDETLGAGGLLQALHAAGAEVEVLVATDGEAAFPELDDAARTALGRTRRAELGAALRELGLDDAAVRWAGLPDSAVREHREELATWLAPLLRGADACLTPWSGDPHPDHRAVAEAARAAAGPRTDIWGYPIWQLPWGSPDDPAVPWETAAGYEPVGAERRRKGAAIRAHRSQLRPPPGGTAPILDGAVIAHFTGGTELLFRESPGATTPVARFAALYARDADPWQTATSAYERRKRAVSCACLPRARYGSGLDVASGSGLLTRDLAARCDALMAIDAVPDAVAATRKAVAGCDNVLTRQARIPQAFPEGPFDLVVCSEILYYLDTAELAMTLDAIAAAQPPGADLLAVSWRPKAPDAPRDAADAHRRLLAHPAWAPIADHTDPEFLALVVRRR